MLTLESDEFPDWDSLADAVQLTPWARELAKLFLKEPQGAWFMTVAAVLEYLYHRLPSQHQDPAQGLPHDGQTTPTGGRHLDHGHDFDADDESHQQHDHEETSAEWLEDQGFDRKD